MFYILLKANNVGKTFPIMRNLKIFDENIFLLEYYLFEPPGQIS